MQRNITTEGNPIPCPKHDRQFVKTVDRDEMGIIEYCSQCLAEECKLFDEDLKKLPDLRKRLKDLRT